MTYPPIRVKRAPSVGRRWARVSRISVLLGVSGWLVAVGAQAENGWREAVTASWQFAEFNFATWGDTGQSRAVLVDMFNRRALDLALTPGTGAVKPEFSASRATDLFPGEAAIAAGEPQDLLYGIKRSNGGFIGLRLNAKNGIPSAVQWYDAALLKRDSTELLNRVGMKGELIEDNRVLSMFDWQPVGDQFFAYGALGIAGRLDVVREGFYITQLQTPDNANAAPLAHMVWDLPGYRHYAFHHDFIAVDGDVVFFLEMSTYPSLLYYDTRNDVHARRLEGFPGSDEPIPYPPEDTIDKMYKSVESMKIPVGLYSSRGFLYALLRQPENGGVTSWKVIKLRPDFDNGTVENLGAVRLPTQHAARHLYVLPGETTWLVLELGSLPPKLMKHRLLAAVTIPQSWITDPRTSPLMEERLRAPVNGVGAILIPSPPNK